MTESSIKNLNLARVCYKEGKETDALAYYALVMDEEPENAQANYFCRYFDFQESIEKKEGVKDSLLFLINSLEKAIKYVADDGCSKGEKMAVVKAIVNTYTPVTDFVISSRISTSKDTIENGVLSLYWLGSYIKNNFNSDSDAMELAIIPWKEAVKLQQKFYAYKYEGYKAENYVAEIQKVDPSFTIPKKAGCVSKG